ncbi:WD domain, G-beta repeat protein [Teladorsagia circumcincta]|uniref:WD domain, G-beta repeat protein n=1 Tax=Teladorsagia circumcincta TaxID=45464 RepID=A0A2G9V3U3_TELCI|nr:WD domain, G-beta repeat protein [Teladorsagia circumcincta]
MAIDLPFVFIGDHGGNVVVLRLSGPISSLAWNRVKEILYSGSHDSLVIMWDIGGKRGEAYELNGHSSKITSLAIAPAAARLFSADDTGKLVCWDMAANRWLGKGNITVEHVERQCVEVVVQIGQLSLEWVTSYRFVYVMNATKRWRKTRNSSTLLHWRYHMTFEAV